MQIPFHKIHTIYDNIEVLNTKEDSMLLKML